MSYNVDSDGRPVIVHMVHALEGGGTERFLVALLQKFDAQRFRHAVVTLRDAGSLASQLPDDVACYSLGIHGRSWRAGSMTARAIRQLRPVILHARNTGCWGDATLAGILTPGAEIVLGFHGLDRTSSFTPRQRFVARWASRFGARFTSVSHAGRAKLHQEAGVQSNRINVLPNGVNLDHFGKMDGNERRRVRHSFSFPDSAFVVGTVGSLTPVKGQSLLLDAIAQLSGTMDNVRLLIVGDGPLRASLTQQATDADLADSVRFCGWRDDVPSLLSAMDVYVCSSASEGMSNAVLEAMASGLPIVATNVGDNAVMIRDGRDGLIIEPQSSTAIARAIKTLVESPDLRTQLGDAARIRAQAYDFDRAVQSYERYYSTLAASRAGRRRTWTSLGLQPARS